MALPKTKEEFVQYCLRKLGAPVIQINVAPEQIDDAFTEALLYFQEYHMDASERMFLRIPVDQDFIVTRTAIVPDNVLSVKEVYSVPNSASKDIVFDVNYHLASDMLWNMMRGTGVGLFDYALLKQSMRDLQMQLMGETMYHYNRHTNKLRIDVGKHKLQEGTVILADVMVMLDPEEYPGLFKNSWLIEYTSTLLKLRWASNLQKFQNVQLPGGVTMNGETLWTQATQDRLALEQEIETKWNSPLPFLVG